MQLKLYVCVRWGHAESPEGADGEDTHFLVRAASHDEAANLTDGILRWLPTQIEGSARGVEPHCQRVFEVGVDTSGSTTPAVVIGPAIGYALRADSSNYPSWCRGEVPGEFIWRPTHEVFGDGT
jgi:hypothetical protein